MRRGNLATTVILVLVVSGWLVLLVLLGVMCCMAADGERADVESDELVGGVAWMPGSGWQGG
jgi:hypothetical protein